MFVARSITLTDAETTFVTYPGAPSGEKAMSSGSSPTATVFVSDVEGRSYRPTLLLNGSPPGTRWRDEMPPPNGPPLSGPSTRELPMDPPTNTGTDLVNVPLVTSTVV